VETLGRPAISGRSQPHNMIYNTLNDHSKSAGGSRLNFRVPPRDTRSGSADGMPQLPACKIMPQVTAVDKLFGTHKVDHVRAGLAV
jgi:hypothetical protein